MKLRWLIFVFPAMVWAQGLDPALLTKPATDAWPTYHGDYSGRRYSVLDQINQSNVGRLTLEWFYKANMNPDVTRTGGEYKDGDPYFWGAPRPFAISRALR